MGNEIGQLREWDEKREQDWNLRKYPIHDSFYRFMKELNHAYLEHPALSSWDYLEEGFSWLDCHQESRRIYAILRRGKDEKLAAIFNFSDQIQNDYEVEIEEAKQVKMLVYSDWNRFGGDSPENLEICTLKNGVLNCTLNPFSAVLLEIK